MSRLKRFFVSPYAMALFIATSHSIYMLAKTGLGSAWLNTAWLGALIATLPGAFFFSRLMLSNVARTSDNTPLLWGSGLIGSVIALMLPSESALPLLYAVFVGLIGGLLYDFWYSRFGLRDDSVLSVGKDLPDFELYYPNGSRLSSSEIKKAPALMLFYRGNWCPLCMAQIEEIAALYRSLNERGVQIYLVSNQSDDNSAKLAEKFEVDMNFMVDKQGKVAETFKIKQAGGTPAGIMGYDADTNMPTVLISDKGGKIIFVDLTDNYRVRPEPDTFIRVLDDHGVALIR